VFAVYKLFGSNTEASARSTNGIKPSEARLGISTDKPQQALPDPPSLGGLWAVKPTRNHHQRHLRLVPWRARRSLYHDGPISRRVWPSALRVARRSAVRPWNSGCHLQVSAPDSAVLGVYGTYADAAWWCTHQRRHAEPPPRSFEGSTGGDARHRGSQLTSMATPTSNRFRRFLHVHLENARF
jgi:hypothetical protein